MCVYTYIYNIYYIYISYISLLYIDVAIDIR